MEADDSIRINPAVMIKRPDEHHDNIQINTSPIMLRNVYSTIASISTGENNIWGPTVYDIDNRTQNQEMLHVVTNQIAGMFDTTGIDYEDGYVRIHPMNTDATAREATVWNPYETNGG